MSMEKISTGKELIDATQNAVIEAAENVSNMIEGLQNTATTEHEVFYLSAEFWVAAAFVLTIILLSRPIYKAVQNMINQRIAYIRKRLENAEQLQADAEKLLASYERKFRNVDQEVENIIKKSQNEIDYLKKSSLSRLEQEMAAKEKDTLDKLSEAKNKASQEISFMAGKLSIKAIRTAVSQNLNDNDISHLIDCSIQKIEKI